MPLIPENLHLSLGQPSKAKHPNLTRNMIPRAGSPLRLQTLTQTTTHLLNTTTHSPEILFPLLKKRLVIQDATGNARTVRRRVRNLRPLQNSQLARNMGSCLRSVGAGGRNKMERARPLAVQTEVLGERLRNAEFKPLLDEVPDCPCVADEIARGEALIRGVEEGEVVPFPHDCGDLFPLVLGWVYACWVVRAGVEEDDGARWRCLQRLQHAVEVEAFGLFVEVGVAC